MSQKYLKNDVLTFMRSVSIAALAVTDGTKPMSSIILFALDDDFTMYFGTHRDSFKSQAILKNPNVSLSIWEHKKMLVQIDAKAQEVSESEKADAFLDKIVSASANVHDFWPPVLQIEGDEYIVFKVRPHWLRVLDLSDQRINLPELPFQELEIV